MVEEDAGSSGIWGADEGDWVNVDYDELDLPPQLIERFEKWTRWYLRPFDEKEFEEEGRALVRELQAFMGPDVHVQYGRLDVPPA
jgi:hypothetical protein